MEKGMSSIEARSILAAIIDEELQEEDVWGVSKEQRMMFNSKTPSLHCSSSFTHRRLPSAARMIPRSNSNIFHEEKNITQHSAPMAIPDWPKIYGSPKTRPGSKIDSWRQHGGGGGWDNNDDIEDEEEDGGGSMVPPHEWIDRRLARSQITSFSMCEGAGRTLKGKDLRRVRNDVLTKTGFLE